MRFFQKLICALVTLSLLQLIQTNLNAQTNDLIPVPKSISYNSEKFNINQDFRVSLQGNYDVRLTGATNRFIKRLSKRTGIFFNNYSVDEKLLALAQLQISVSRSGRLFLKEDESYKLEVSDRSISLISETDIGAMRGLESLLQLFQCSSAGYFFKGCTITDSPRFPWRGLMIDVARHFMPVDVIKRNIDGMAAVKMNVLHLHLTDDQGFRVECKSFPKLHKMGSDEEYYTHEQITEIVNYAGLRGIRVIPEFDIPGHATSWLVGYPELASAPGPTKLNGWGIFDPTINPIKENTYSFFEKFLGEMCSLFPDDYIHIGGDENEGKHWDANHDIQKFKTDHGLKDNHALQNYFNSRILGILKSYGKRMIGWDEILNEDLPGSAVIHSWRGTESLIEAARQGYDAMLSNGYYIDLMYPAEDHYLNDPISEKCSLDSAESLHVIGGEATMWSEYVDANNIDSRIWPRTAAIAERFWSPRSIKDVDDMYRRLGIISIQLEEHGLEHIKNRKMMIRNLIGDNDPSSIIILLNAIEPVKEYKRETLKTNYSYSPLTRIIDIATPDAKDARFVKKELKKLLNGQDYELSKLFKIFKKWLINHVEIKTLCSSYPILREVKTLSRDISECASLLLNKLSGDGLSETSIKWDERLEMFFEEAKIPKGELELIFLDEVIEVLKKDKR